MAKHDPIAYTYDADYHCPDCAEKACGRDENGDIVGEEVGAVFPWDEWYHCGYQLEQILNCGTCGEELDRYEGDSEHE